MNLKKTEELYKEMFNQQKLNDLAHKIKIRDGWTCSVCGKFVFGSECIAHHIKSKEEFPEIMYDESNMVVVCISCHSKIHHKAEFLLKRMVEVWCYSNSGFLVGKYRSISKASIATGQKKIDINYSLKHGSKTPNGMVFSLTYLGEEINNYED